MINYKEIDPELMELFISGQIPIGVPFIPEYWEKATRRKPEALCEDKAKKLSNVKYYKTAQECAFMEEEDQKLVWETSMKE